MSVAAQEALGWCGELLQPRQAAPVLIEFNQPGGLGEDRGKAGEHGTEWKEGREQAGQARMGGGGAQIVGLDPNPSQAT